MTTTTRVKHSQRFRQALAALESAKNLLAFSHIDVDLKSNAHCWEFRFGPHFLAVWWPARGRIKLVTEKEPRACPSVPRAVRQVIAAKRQLVVD